MQMLKTLDSAFEALNAEAEKYAPTQQRDGGANTSNTRGGIGGVRKMPARMQSGMMPGPPGPGYGSAMSGGFNERHASWNTAKISEKSL